ncbi:MAG: Holliday junction resolvase RuvX [candidate division KSB1 bacterium]|nr:Holliday junction resolvase RuvX [candidate division KSB1 bacterium]
MTADPKEVSPCRGKPTPDDGRRRYLGIDYGTRRIGVAISDPLGLLAHPLTTLEGGSETSRLERLVEIIRQLDVQAVIVGMPLTMRGEEGKEAERARAFAARLAERIAVPIRAWDERLTTVTAQRKLRSAGRRPSRNRPIVDQIAAVEILQSYLDWLRGRAQSDRGGPSE